jgi:hypothetical protein
MGLQSIKFVAGREDIWRKLGDIADRPGQQWRDDFFGHPWGTVLADVTITSDAGWSASAPRLEPQPSGGKMIAKSVEIDRHFEEVANNDRPSTAIGLEMAGIAVEQLLIDPREIDGAEFRANELEETARPVEYLPDTGRWKLFAMTGEIDVEPGIEQLPDRFAGADIFDRAEMYGDMATAGVLAEYRRTEIPACIAIAGQAAPIEALLQRRGSKNRTVIQILWERSEGNFTHGRTSGGR